MPLSEDERRVRRALAGDARAFEELYAEYRSAVFKVAFGVTGNVEDALDVTQETFIKAHRSLEAFEGRASVLTWLCQIAIHKGIDLERRKKVRRAVGLEDYMTPAGVGHGSAMARGGTALLDDDATPAQPPRTSVPPRVPASVGPTHELDPAVMASGNELKRALDRALAELSEKHRTVFLLYTVKGLSYKEISDALGISIGTVMSRLFYARKNLQGLLAEYAS
jgi:RNA polymerase sigma-70 factor (ECF subfamily)